MPAQRRRELVDAGISLVVAQCFQDLLSAVDTRSITDAAGVTTGSFFHHFANRGEFAAAVADRFVELWGISADTVVGDIEAFADSEDGQVRTVAQDDWDKLAASLVEADVQHLLWVSRDQPLTERGGATAGEVLAGCYQYLLDIGVPAYRKAVSAMGREMLPPFDEVDLCVTMTALADGIQMRQAVQPDVVRPELFADLVAGTLIALTRPRGEQAEDVRLSTLEVGLLTSPVSRTLRSPGEGEPWRAIADAAAPLFDDRLVHQVKVAEIAEVAGVSPSTVYHQFGRVSAVAACGWAQHIAELQAISAVPITAEEGPVRRMEQVLARYVELGKQHRGALDGLMAELLTDLRDAGHGDPVTRVATAVPMPDLLQPHLRELRARGHLRRRMGSGMVARTILQLASTRALFTPDDPTERIVDDTLGLVLEGVLTTRSAH